MKTRILLISFFILNFFQVNAQSNDEVTLIVSADGVTKEEATKVALRSAIEQADGTFVSANTTLLNDELVKDEIVTISNGNIKKYKEIASLALPNGNQSVTLQATVCVSKLVSYVQSKGASAEFAGQTFMMNLKLKEFYKNNERIAIQNMLDQLSSIPSLFDTELVLKDPIIKGKDVIIDFVITLKYNDNLDAFNKIALSTITSLDQSNKKKRNREMDKEFNWVRTPYRNLNLRSTASGFFPNEALFWNYNYNLVGNLLKILKKDISKFTIKANTGETVFSFEDGLINYEDHFHHKMVEFNFRDSAGEFGAGSGRFFYDRSVLRVFKYGYDYKGIRDLTRRGIIWRESFYTIHEISEYQHVPDDYIGYLEGSISIPKNEISKYSNFYVDYKKE